MDDETKRASAALGPKDHAEAVALFRAQVIGPVLARGTLGRGELADALRELAAERFRPPGSDVSRSYGVSTLERWYYRYRDGGLAALRPRPRSDRGAAQKLAPEARQLVLDIRRQHPRASAEMILRTLVTDGRLPEDAVSPPTVRRLFREHGLDPKSLAASDRLEAGRGPRRRWTAPHPNAVWHADVCHGPALRVDGRAVPLRIHALLDDHSRYVPAIQAATTERESEMLALLVRALRLGPAPEVLYLDNGSTYSGDALRTMCSRLGITLVHAEPHDPEARGKMERFWRTLRAQCLDYCAGLGSVHDVQVRLVAWLDQHYHVTAHAGLFGKPPAAVYEAAPGLPVDERELEAALTVAGRRRVRRDGTLDVAGRTFELAQGFLAGRRVDVFRTLLDPTSAPWVEHEGTRFPLLPVDPVKNGARRKTTKRTHRGIDAVPFDPPSALLGRMLGRARRADAKEATR